MKYVGKLRPHSRFRVRFRESERRVLPLLGGRSNRDVEYDFAYRNVCGKGLRVLDIGGCDSVLSLFLARGGHHVTVYDYRRYLQQQPNLLAIQGSSLENELPANSFDIAILISTIEHIGLASYGAPEHSDAGFEVMREVRRVLADDGRVALTFPFNESEVVIPGFKRWHTPDRLKRLFDGWSVVDCEYWVPDFRMFSRWLRYRPGTIAEAGCAYRQLGGKACTCFALSVRPVKRF